MNDRPPDFEDDDLDMGEPVTDKLNVLLDELPEGHWAAEGGERDMGEPVTDKVHLLLEELPKEFWAEEEGEIDLGEPVTDKLQALLDELPDDTLSTRVRHAVERRRLSSEVPRRGLRGAALAVGGFFRSLFGRRGGPGE